jgi:hypothetical protein
LIVSFTLGFSGWFPHPTKGIREEYPYPPIGPQEAFSSMNNVHLQKGLNVLLDSYPRGLMWG